MSKTLLIVDDHPLVAEGLKSLFTQEGFQVVGECSNASEAAEIYLEKRPELVVSDLMMPGLCILETCKELKSKGHKFKLIFISAYISDYNLVRALDLGAEGIICKSDDPANIINGVHEVFGGKRFLSQEIQNRIEHYPKEDERPKLGVEILTPREKEVMKYIALGRSLKEIASEMNVAASTVDTHRTNVMRKLNLHTQIALVRYAIREGIILP